jgi:non-specific serine/threonine protein kinase
VELAQTLVPYHHKALPEGSILREWRLESVLGVGGFGIVYRGRGVYFNETVAIKEYFPGAISDRLDGTTVTPADSSSEDVYALGLEKFVEEAKLLWELSKPEPHPNIVSVRSLFEANGTAYMVMDFEDGAPLSEFIRPGRFEETGLLKLLRPIAEGLDRAHAAGVIHRDIKPSNIIIRENKAPVLIDFGSARFDAGQATSTTVTFYTPPYAALEQYVRTLPQGPWTDIYALGVVLYQCVTGDKPPEALERLHGGERELLSARAWPGFSRGFTRAVDAAMAIQPAERPQSIAEWLRLFDRRSRDGDDELTRIRSLLTTGEKTRVRVANPAPLAAAPSPLRRSAADEPALVARKAAPRVNAGRPWVAAGVVLAGVAAVGAAGALLVSQPRPKPRPSPAPRAALAARQPEKPSIAIAAASAPPAPDPTVAAAPVFAPPRGLESALSGLAAAAGQAGAPPGLLAAVSEARSRIGVESAKIRALGSQPLDGARAAQSLAAIRGDAASLATREAGVLSSDTHGRAAEAQRILGDAGAVKVLAADGALRRACAALAAASESAAADPTALLRSARAALAEYAAFNQAYADASRQFVASRRDAFARVASEAQGRATRAIAAAAVAKPWFLASQSRKQAYLRLQSDAARAKSLQAQLAQLSQSAASATDVRQLDQAIAKASALNSEIAGLGSQTAVAGANVDSAGAPPAAP